MLRASLFAILLSASPVFSETARIEHACMGNAVESCFIIVAGKLTTETLAEFQTMLEEPSDGFKVLMNSSGGSLNVGLALGRLFREKGMHTEIGKAEYRTINVNNTAFEQFDNISNGECVSACAYAFLGGVVRRVRGESRLGFHRFSLTAGDVPGEGGLAAGQLVAADIISYLVEMGVDARIFAQASGAAQNEMNYPTREELDTFDLVTPTGYSPFSIEPYRQGVIAVSRRLDATRGYDHAFQLTAYCRNRQPYFLLTVDYPVFGEEQSTTEDAIVELDGRRLRVQDFSVRKDDSNSYLIFQFAEADVRTILSAGALSVTYFQPRAAGGPQEAKIETTETDKEMLSAAFRFCI